MNKDDKKLAEQSVKESKPVTALSAIQNNEALAKLYNENATVGAEHVAESAPILRVHMTGKSSANELADGKEPNDGWFFYKPTQQQFKEIECHIVTISSGFRSKGLVEGKTTFNQILAGVILGQEKLLPFYFYFSGKKLQNLWDFGKEVSKYTKMKPVSIPMFALKVKLTTESVKTNFGKSWIVKFDIVKDENGFPIVVTDQKLFEILKRSVVRANQTISAIIEASSVDVPEPEELKPLGEDQTQEYVDATIPF